MKCTFNFNTLSKDEINHIATSITSGVLVLTDDNIKTLDSIAQIIKRDGKFNQAKYADLQKKLTNLVYHAINVQYGGVSRRDTELLQSQVCNTIFGYFKKS